MENISNYAVNIDSDCLSKDFDEIDFYGNKVKEDNTSDTDLQFE